MRYRFCFILTSFLCLVKYICKKNKNFFTKTGVLEKFFLHGIAKVGQNGTNLKKDRADWITGAELHCTCKMALPMAPQAFISTIDNALYALRLKRADWTGRLDLPSPTGSPAQAASATNGSLPGRLPDAPIQIQTDARKHKEGQPKLSL